MVLFRSQKRLPFSIEREEESPVCEKVTPIVVREDDKAPENGYRFLPGTPLSIFCSSVQTDHTAKADRKDSMPLPDSGKDDMLPEGSERIDDIL